MTLQVYFIRLQHLFCHLLLLVHCGVFTMSFSIASLELIQPLFWRIWCYSFSLLLFRYLYKIRQSRICTGTLPCRCNRQIQMYCVEPD